ncbi:MAG: CopD family protein [Actinomycetota bacterium]|nr:CopD family protein [Actinomycetota bacterium]
MGRLAACFAMVVGVLVATAPAAGAHALLRSSEPVGGAMIHDGPSAVVLTFSQAPDLKISSVDVLDSSGRSMAAGGVEHLRGRPETLRLPINHLDQGPFTVVWRIVSGVDGDMTTDSFVFGVRTPIAATAAATSPGQEVTRPVLLDVGGRSLLYAGLIVLLGGSAVGGLVLRQSPAPTTLTRLLSCAWVATAVGLIGFTGAKLSPLDIGVATLWDSSLGRAVLWRAVPVAVAGVGVVVATRSARRWRLGVGLTGVAAAATVLAHVRSGHAAAGSAGPMIALQWVHVVAVATWLGGLATLLIVVRGVADAAKASAVRRYSTLAGVAIAVVALTGVVRAVNEVGAWGRLTATTYGKLVLVKAAALVLLGLLGAVNRYRHVPRAGQTLRGLQRIGTAEVAVAVGAILVTGMLTTKTPSVVLASVEVPPVVVGTGDDFGTTVRAELTISPGAAGPNRFLLRLADYDTGQPVTADQVGLRFQRSGVPMGGSTRELTAGKGGTYSGHGPDLSMVGRWTVTVLAERGLDTVEVPVEVSVRPRG